MARERPRLDFSPFEPRYPRVFALLRQHGWTSNRFVEFPDVDLDPAGAPRGEIILNDFAEAFLHSFYGIEVVAKHSWGDRRVLFGFDERFETMRMKHYLEKLDGFSGYTFPYPILAWETMTGFATERGDAFAVDDFYQVYVRAPDPFRLAERALFNEQGPDLEKGYLERPNVPFDYWPLIWNRPLDYHLPKYKAFALTEGDHTEYVLQHLDYPKLFQVIVTELVEDGSTLRLKYRRTDPEMLVSVATALIVQKLLVEFFERTFNNRIQRIELTDHATKEVTATTWPRDRA